MGLWLEMNDTDESVKFVRSHKRCSPEGDVDMARLGAGGGAGDYGKNSLYF